MTGTNDELAPIFCPSRRNPKNATSKLASEGITDACIEDASTSATASSWRPSKGVTRSGSPSHRLCRRPNGCGAVRPSGGRPAGMPRCTRPRGRLSFTSKTCRPRAQSAVHHRSRRWAHPQLFADFGQGRIYIPFPTPGPIESNFATWPGKRSASDSAWTMEQRDFCNHESSPIPRRRRLRDPASARAISGS